MSTHPQLPRTHEVLTPDSFAEYAIDARPGHGAFLVATVLDAAGVSSGDLVIVPDLPDAPGERSRILARTTLYLHAAATPDWAYLAYAIVDVIDGRNVAFVVIDPATPSRP